MTVMTMIMMVILMMAMIMMMMMTRVKTTKVKKNTNFEAGKSQSVGHVSHDRDDHSDDVGYEEGRGGTELRRKQPALQLARVSRGHTEA